MASTLRWLWLPGFVNRRNYGTMVIGGEQIYRLALPIADEFI